MSVRTAEHWTFLTNHARVLVCVGQTSDARMREIARRVGITERQVHAIINDLEEAGYVSRERVGRRNHYYVYRAAAFRHAFEGSATVGQLLDLFAPAPRSEDAERPTVRLAI